MFSYVVGAAHSALYAARAMYPNIKIEPLKSFVNRVTVDLLDKHSFLPSLTLTMKKDSYVLGHDATAIPHDHLDLLSHGEASHETRYQNGNEEGLPGDLGSKAEIPAVSHLRDGFYDRKTLVVRLSMVVCLLSCAYLCILL